MTQAKSIKNICIGVTLKSIDASHITQFLLKSVTSHVNSPTHPDSAISTPSLSMDGTSAMNRLIHNPKNFLPKNYEDQDFCDSFIIMFTVSVVTMGLIYFTVKISCNLIRFSPVLPSCRNNSINPYNKSGEWFPHAATLDQMG